MPFAAGGDKDGQFCKANTANTDAGGEAVSVGGAPATRHSSTYSHGPSGGSESAVHFHQELVCFVPGRVVPDPGQDDETAFFTEFAEEHAGEKEACNDADAGEKRQFGSCRECQVGARSAPVAGKISSAATTGQLREPQLGMC